MKRILAWLSVFALFLLPLAAAAQGHQAAVHPQLQPLLSGAKADRVPESLRGPLAGFQGRHSLEGHEALDLEIRTTATREQLESPGIHVRTLRAGIATLTVLPSRLRDLAARPDVSLVTIPRPNRPVLSKSLPDTGISRLRTFSGGSFTGATGAGVLVAVIDSGLDVNHPNFKDGLGNSRVRFLWDQTHAPSGAGTVPSPFNYGTEWTAADIDAGQCTELDDPNQEAHGTHVTGTAAGNGAAPDENGIPYSHVGVAPEAGILFVKSDLTSTHVIDALDYVFQKADELGMPCVVNMSFGSNVGAHDGTDSMEQTIDSLVTAKAGRAAVVAAGNARTDAAHSQLKVAAGATVAGPTIAVPSYAANPGAINDYFIISAYYASTDAISIQLISPTGITYNRSLSNANSCLGPLNDADGTVQICNTKVSNLDQATTSREIFVQVWDNIASKPPRAGAWKVNLTGNTVTGAGTIDLYLQSGVGTKQAAFSTLVTTTGTLGVPATSKQAISAGAHITRQCWTDYNHSGEQYASTYVPGDIAPFSSQGPTRDGRSKPEITAPGMGIIAPLAANAKTPLINAGFGAFIVNDFYQLMQGTSMAAPHITGAVALLFQKDPTLAASAVTSALEVHARNDLQTRKYAGPGVFTFLGNSFGWGKLDLGGWAYTDTHETNDTVAQATLVLSGQTMSGYIDRPDDADYYNIDALVAGDTVDISLTGLTQDYALALQSQTTPLTVCQDGSMLTKATSNNAGTANEAITYTAYTGIQISQSAPSYIRVISSAGGFDEANAYQMTAILTRPETTSVHSSTATAQKLPDFMQIKVAGTLAVSNETDFYSFTVSAGSTINATAAGRTIKLYDANGNFVTSAGGVLNYTTPGGFFLKSKYYVVVTGGAASSYTLTLKV